MPRPWCCLNRPFNVYNQDHDPEWPYVRPIRLRRPLGLEFPPIIRIPARPGSTWCDLARPQLSAKRKPHHDVGAALESRPPDFHRYLLERLVLAQRPTERITSGLDVHLSLIHI